EKLIGVPTMDHNYLTTTALRESGVPLTVVRPSLFMDNLLTKWVKPGLLSTGVFSYPHREDLEVSWICLDDVARFMIAALGREDMEGRTVDVGGPEALKPTQVAQMLGEVIGRPVSYERITPREFGTRLYEIFKDVSGQDRETYISNLEKHYLFKNDTNPFYVPVEDTLLSLPVKLTPMREWLRQQDWSGARGELVGSVSG
ncbi:MAG TPA: NmrA family NAD(P)-binding protein, partial [Phenylobacterium sp.]|nr:NmrA family NAD(P)-binding protein [Phenylobacterium sp.]